MRNIILFLLLLGCSLAGYESYAQYENVWAFGYQAGVDFNVNPPQAIRTNMGTEEGCASMCNEQGALLFYTDGTTVWDRNHVVMKNGENLPGASSNVTASTTQGALVIPIPGREDHYYVFSLGQMNFAISNSPYLGKLYYSIVNMQLNDGLGDVLPDKKGILLDTLLTEHMMAVSGNNCNVWLLALSRSDTTLKAFNVDSRGIDAVPVKSARMAGQGQFMGMLGSIDVSPDRRKLAIAQGNLMLYDFNADSGTISNPLLLDGNAATSYYYGTCFSPDNSKLYGSDVGFLKQFNVALPDTNAIKASGAVIASGLVWPAMKRAPDGKVYIANAPAASLNIVHQPNLAGMACRYAPADFLLLPGTRSALGLPNIAAMVKHRRFYRSYSDTVRCVDSILVKAADTTGINYIWNDGTGGSERYIKESGVYWVSYQKFFSQCDEYVDTFKLMISNLRRTHSLVTLESTCSKDSILLKPTETSGGNYVWEDGSVGQERLVDRRGLYWLSYGIDSLCRLLVDSFEVIYPEKPYKVTFGSDTVSCQGEPVLFHNTSATSFHSFRWSFGDDDSSTVTHPEHIYPYPGNFSVRLIGYTGDHCSDTAYQNLTIDTLENSFFTAVPNSACVGEAIRFLQADASKTVVSIHWQFGDGTALLYADREPMAHAYAIAGLFPVKRMVYFRACPEREYSDTVRIHDLPLVDLGADSVLCLKGAAIRLFNHYPVDEHNLYEWSNGSVGPEMEVIHPGTYTLSVTNRYHCSTTETITVSRDCYLDIPNAFTPNGDGINDFFFDGRFLSGNLIRYHLQVFDRWGRLIFDNRQENGRGWDGRYAGREMPAGAYVYHIEAHFVNGQVEKVDGNIALIR